MTTTTAQRLLRQRVPLRSLPNRVWRTYPGGRVLDRLEGRPEPRDEHFPEDWIASVTRAVNPGREAVVEGLARLSAGGESEEARVLLEADPEYCLGRAHLAAYGAQPMLLVKLLDSAVRLHFQCHPTAAFARAHLGSRSGKAEAYHILAIREEVAEPYVYLGFQRPPSAAQLKEWIERQDLAAIESCFDRIPVRPGDNLFIPGGFPHAIGEGILLVEIMEPSDLAVRFEFAKAGYVLPEEARFLKRGLDFALTVFDYRAVPAEEVRARYLPRPRRECALGPESHREELIGPDLTPCFRVCQGRVRGTAAWCEEQASILVVTAGQGFLETEGGRLEVSPYDRFFLPAGLGEVRAGSAGEMTFLQCFPPAPGAL